MFWACKWLHCSCSFHVLFALPFHLPLFSPFSFCISFLSLHLACFTYSLPFFLFLSFSSPAIPSLSLSLSLSLSHSVSPATRQTSSFPGSVLTVRQPRKTHSPHTTAAATRDPVRTITVDKLHIIMCTVLQCNMDELP